MAKTKFVCGVCGTEKHIDSDEPSLDTFKDPTCCGKKMYVAS